MKKYRVTWTEVSKHERLLTSEELAALVGVSVEEFEEDPSEHESNLADDLADLDDDGFEGLERTVDAIEEV